MASDPDLDEVRRIIAENVETSFGLPARAHSALVSRAILNAAGSAEQLAQIAAADEQLGQRLAQADARAGGAGGGPEQPPAPRPLIAIHNAQTGDIRAENIAGGNISIHHHYHGGRRRRGVQGSNRRAAKRNEPGPDPQQHRRS
jgi:hypothetical protein